MNAKRLRLRRVSFLLMSAIIGVSMLYANPSMWQVAPDPVESPDQQSPPSMHSVVSAKSALEALPVKGKAPKTGYARTQFGNGWERRGLCDMRNIILNRDLSNVVLGDECKVLSGKLNDPYTGAEIMFVRGADTSDRVQIDHVVALSNAWQTGAQQLGLETRMALANDPLELLAVDGPANQQKSDGDAATWLPSNRQFRCQYVARQVAVKTKYSLWVTQAEHDAIERVLGACPGQLLPVE